MTIARIIDFNWDHREQRLTLTTDNKNLRALFRGGNGKHRDDRQEEYISSGRGLIGKATVLFVNGDFSYGADTSSRLKPWEKFDEATSKSYPSESLVIYAFGRREVACLTQEQIKNKINAMLIAEEDSHQQHEKDRSLDPNYYITLRYGRKVPKHFLGGLCKSIIFKTAPSLTEPKSEFYAYVRSSYSNTSSIDNDKQIQWEDKEDAYVKELEKKQTRKLLNLTMQYQSLSGSTHKRVRSLTGSQHQVFARRSDPALRQPELVSTKQMSYKGYRPTAFTHSISAHNDANSFVSTAMFMDKELIAQYPKNSMCITGSYKTNTKKHDMLFPGLLSYQGGSHCVGAIEIRKNGETQVTVYDFTHHSLAYKKNKNWVLGKLTKEQNRKNYKKIKAEVDKITIYKFNKQGQLINPEIRLEKSLTESYRVFDEQIKLALSKGYLNWVNYFLAGLGYLPQDFNPTTLNNNVLLKKTKKSEDSKHSRSSIKSLPTSSSNASKNTETKQQDNLLQRLWKAANNAGGKACSSHMIEYQLALEALFKSYNALNDTTPNIQTKFFRALSLIHAYISTLNYYNDEKLPLERAYKDYQNNIDTQVTVEKPRSTNHINVVIDDSTSSDDEYNSSDSSDDEDEPLLNTPQQSIVVLDSGKKRFKKNDKISFTAKRITTVMRLVLSHFQWVYQLPPRQSMPETAKDHLQEEPKVAFSFILQQMLSILILDPIAYLPLIRELCKSPQRFPKIPLKGFRKNLLRFHGNLFDFKFDRTQRNLLIHQGITNPDEQTKLIKQADAHAKLFANLLQDYKIFWITMNHALNRSLVLGSGVGAFKCTETLAMSSAINAYCAEAYFSPWVWQRTLKNQRNHLKTTLNKHLIRLKKVATIQALHQLSLFKLFKKCDDSTLSLKYIAVLNKLTNALYQKIKTLSHAIHASRPNEKILCGALDALNMPRSLITIVSRQTRNASSVFAVNKTMSLSKIDAFFNKKMARKTKFWQDSSSDDDARELEVITAQGIFENNATAFFLQGTPSSETYDKYVPGMKLLLGNRDTNEPLLLTREKVQNYNSSIN